MDSSCQKPLGKLFNFDFSTFLDTFCEHFPLKIHGWGVTTPILAVLSSTEKERKSGDFQKSGTRQINMFSVFWLILWQPTMLRYLRKLVKVHAGVVFRPNIWCGAQPRFWKKSKDLWFLKMPALIWHVSKWKLPQKHALSDALLTYVRSYRCLKKNEIRFPDLKVFFFSSSWKYFFLPQINCVDVLMCWCVDVWCVDVLMCWCVDVLICCCAGDCVEHVHNYVGYVQLMRWCVDVDVNAEEKKMSFELWKKKCLLHLDFCLSHFWQKFLGRPNSISSFEWWKISAWECLLICTIRIRVKCAGVWKKKFGRFREDWRRVSPKTTPNKLKTKSFSLGTFAQFWQRQWQAQGL